MLAAPPTPEVAVPETARRWIEESREWLKERQARGTYQGRNGYEAARFLAWCGRTIESTPLRVSEPDLWSIVNAVGPAPKTKRTYLAILGSFLAWRGNPIVQGSGIRQEFPNRARETPILPSGDRDRILDAAQGVERVIVALLCLGRRPVEILRARVEDFHLDRVPATYEVRQKGGGGSVTDTDVPISWASRDLVWWLPMRQNWALEADSDSGHLICRWDGRELVGVSIAYLSRAVRAAEERAGTRPWPLYSFRRGTLTLLREAGADWDDVSSAALHSSPETTRIYVDPLVRRRRLESALTLIAPAARGKV